MEKKQYIIAIEIGSSKIVGVIAQKELPEEAVSIRAIQETKISESVRYGCIKNVEEVKRNINEVIAKLNAQIKDAEVTSIYLSLAGRSIRNEIVQVKKQFSIETPITQDIINEILQEGRKTTKTGFDVLDVVPQRFLIDNVEAKKPVGTFASNISATINTIIGKSTLKANLQRVIDPSIKVNGIILTPLAVAKHVLSYDERQLGCMLVDLGAETTTVSIYKNDALLHLATLPFGGRNITRDIMSLNVLEENAENLKITAGNAMPPSESLDQSAQIDGIMVQDISKLVVARSGEIIANINEQFKFANINPEDLAHGIILIGGASKLNGFRELIEKSCHPKVKFGTYPQHINILSKKAQESDLYIQAASIATEVAERIDPETSCITRINKPEDIEQEPLDTDNKNVDVKKTKETDKSNDGRKKQGLNLLTKLKNIFTENSTEEDEDGSYD
ncbi:MAG: cell division protein FtsA [Bacteroidales bacterium]|nr:cell division protein FtsA [Bacteroidales bacterium]